MSCFVNGSLFTEVLPLCGCLTFLKANDSPGLQTCFVDLWTCAQCAGGPLHEVLLCACTGLTCFAVAAVVVGVEGVMVLKEVSVCAICAVFIVGTVLGTVLELCWYYMVLCFYHRSCRIWKTLDVPSDVPVFILKFGTFSTLNVAPYLSKLGQSFTFVTIKVLRYFSPLNSK